MIQGNNKFKYNDSSYISVPSHIRVNVWFTKDKKQNVIIDTELMTDEFNVDLSELNKLIINQINKIKNKP